MKIDLWMQISARIITVFVIFMLLSFIPEMPIMHQFFGDEICATLGYHNGGQHDGIHYHWGYRHWLWITMGVLLAIVQLVRMILFIDKYAGKQ